MSQKLPANDFKWAADISEFNESFIKSYNEENDKGYFLEVDFQYPNNLHNLPNDLLFLHERIKIEKVERLAANLHDKKRICYSHNKFKTSIKSWISFGKSS